MKKTLSFLLCLITLLSFAACSEVPETVDIPLTPPERGTISNKTYKSNYTDLSFTVPSENWTFTSTEELALFCNIDEEVFSSESFEKLLKENSTVYDVIAESQTDKLAILIGFENPKLSSLGKLSSASDFVNTAMDKLVDTFGSENTSYQLSDLESVTLSGHQYVKKTLTVMTDSESASQTYYARNLGDYLSVIIITHMGDTTCAQVESLFS